MNKIIYTIMMGIACCNALSLYAADGANNVNDFSNFKMPKDFKIPVEVGFAPEMKFNIEPNLVPRFDLSALTEDKEKKAQDVRDLGAVFINPRNSLHFGGLLGITLAIIVSGYFAIKVLWNVINKKVMDPKPVILLPGAKYGRWDRVKRWWNNYKTPEMIFDQETKERLEEVVAKARYIRTNNKKRKDNKITYDNLLLQGEPGTGKTLFARILADETDMDFVAVTAASLLQSGVAGVKYFNELVDMARRSKYGLIIFIDEADALFVDRDTLDPDSDHYKVLSHILALTGEGNSTFMLVAATNHAHVLDPAMSRRFQDFIMMPLPDAVTRRQVINLYIKNELFNIRDNGKQFVQVAQALFTQSIIDYIVAQTEGLSHAEIKDIVQSMHKKAQITEDGMITASHIARALQQGVEKHMMFEEFLAG